MYSRDVCDRKTICIVTLDIELKQKFQLYFHLTCSSIIWNFKIENNNVKEIFFSSKIVLNRLLNFK